MYNIKFSNVHLKTLMQSGKVDDAKNYMSKFFFNYQDKVFFYDGDKFMMKNRLDAKSLISKDCCKEIKVANEDTKKFEKIKYNASDFLFESWFMEKQYVPEIDFDRTEITYQKPQVKRGFTYQADYVNMAKELKIKVDDIDRLLKNKNIQKLETELELVFDHIEKVLCNSNKELYRYTLNWIACTLNGRKLRTLLYLQSAERTGKGIIINELIKGILGDTMFKSNSVETLLKYNKPFEGTLLVNLDEMPTQNEGKNISDTIKSLTTEPEFTIRDMYSTPYNQKNTFNIIITSNNNCVLLTQSNNQRYVCLDINESKIGNKKYFEALRDVVTKPEIKALFYKKMIERFKKLGDWNEDDKPMTNTKKIKIIEALPRIYKYIKENYLYHKRGINDFSQIFYDTYYKETNDRTTKNQIGRYLKKIGVEPKKQSKNNGYKYIISYTDLLNVYQKNEWIDELVDLLDAKTPPKKLVYAHEFEDEFEDEDEDEDDDDDEQVVDEYEYEYNEYEYEDEREELNKIFDFEENPNKNLKKNKVKDTSKTSDINAENYNLCVSDNLLLIKQKSDLQDKDLADFLDMF